MNFNLLKNKNLIVFVLISGIFISKIFFLTKLNGLGWEADEYMHFLEAKTLFTNFPNNLDIGIGVWSKPGYVYLYGILITIFNITSLIQAQIITILLGLITGWLVLKILEALKCSFKIQILGLVLVNFSFLMFRGSLSIMTEPIFALFLTAGIYFLLKNKFNMAALMIGFLPLVRIEGLFFVATGLMIIIVSKFRQQHFEASSFELRHLIPLLIPTVIWNFLGFLMTNRFFYVVDSGYPLTPGKYGHGGWPYYFEGFLKLDPVIFILFVISAVYIYRFFRKKDWIKFGIVFSFLLFFVLQVIFWKFGLFATAGLMRYFVTVLPLAIIAIALFFERLFKTSKDSLEKYLIVFAICFIQIFFTVMLFMRGGIVFNQQTRAQIEPGIKEAGQWIHEYVSSDEKLYADVPEVIYFAGRDLNNSTIFGVNEALAKNESAIYVFKRGIERENSFFDKLPGVEIVSFNDNVFIVKLL